MTSLHKNCITVDANFLVAISDFLGILPLTEGGEEYPNLEKS